MLISYLSVNVGGEKSGKEIFLKTSMIFLGFFLNDFSNDCSNEQTSKILLNEAVTMKFYHQLL